MTVTGEIGEPSSVEGGREEGYVQGSSGSVAELRHIERVLHNQGVIQFMIPDRRSHRHQSS